MTDRRGVRFLATVSTIVLLSGCAEGGARKAERAGEGVAFVADLATAGVPGERAALNALSFLGGQAPVTRILEAHGWSLDAANFADAIYDEFADRGIELLLPYYNGGSVGLFCREPGRDLNSLRGAQSATSSATQTEQARDLGLTPASIAVSQSAWDSLPLVAQQLLYDRLDVYLTSSITGVWNNAVLALDEIEKVGGEVEPFPDDARDKLRTSNA